MKQKQRGKIAFFVAAVILFMGTAASSSVLVSRMIPYSHAQFVNVMPLLPTEDTDGAFYENIRYPGADGSDDISEKVGGGNDAASTDAAEDPDEIGFGQSDPSEEDGGEADVAPGQSSPTPAVGGNEPANPEFHMEAEVAIFKFSYDETGKITVIGPEGNPDKLIAPGTSNLYQFTLANTGNVALSYDLTMEAYVTGTDLWLPVNARVWDYTNKYLVGSPDEMPDVMELNTVDEHSELGAGKYAIYNLEWEWPFERPDENGDITENDIYDTMLGNLAVGEDLVLHIVIRTYAEYDEESPGPGLTEPPKTGDEAPILALALICGFSLLGFFAMILAVAGSGRKEKKKKAV